jgi:hypothetical protein
MYNKTVGRLPARSAGSSEVTDMIVLGTVQIGP